MSRPKRSQAQRSESAKAFVRFLTRGRGRLALLLYADAREALRLTFNAGVRAGRKEVTHD